MISTETRTARVREQVVRAGRLAPKKAILVTGDTLDTLAADTSIHPPSLSCPLRLQPRF